MSHPASSFRRLALLCSAFAAFASLAAPVHAISRAQVLARAQAWVDANTSYSWNRYARLDGSLVPTSAASASALGYRTDCSGYASMALALEDSRGNPVSLDSASLPYRCTEITGTVQAQKAALKPGDLMIRPKTSSYGGHVVVFVRWADAAKTRYVGYHERGSAYGTVANEIPYPYWGSAAEAARMRPFRYKQIEDVKFRRSRTWFGPLGVDSSTSRLRVSVEASALIAPSPASLAPSFSTTSQP